MFRHETCQSTAGNLIYHLQCRRPSAVCSFKLIIVIRTYSHAAQKPRNAVCHAVCNNCQGCLLIIAPPTHPHAKFQSPRFDLFLYAIHTLLVVMHRSLQGVMKHVLTMSALSECALATPLHHAALEPCPYCGAAPSSLMDPLYSPI